MRCTDAAPGAAESVKYLASELTPLTSLRRKGLPKWFSNVPIKQVKLGSPAFEASRLPSLSRLFSLILRSVHKVPANGLNERKGSLDLLIRCPLFLLALLLYLERCPSSRRLLSLHWLAVTKRSAARLPGCENSKNFLLLPFRPPQSPPLSLSFRSTLTLISLHLYKSPGVLVRRERQTEGGRW